jgi:mannose-6-phosphate isomerase
VIRKVDKPWGHEIIFAHTKTYAGKILFLRAGERLSLQYHERKEETIFLLSGRLELQIESGGRLETRILEAGEGAHIAPGVRHRMSGVTDCQIAEASTAELSDVVRLEDAYGRAVSPAGGGESGVR